MTSAEQPIKEGILAWLLMQGAYAINVQSGSILTEYNDQTYKVDLAPPGTPDIIGWFKGHPFGVEVKRDDAERERWRAQWRKHKETGEFKKSWLRSILQHQAQTAIEAAGGTYLCCVGIEDIESDFRELGWLPE